METPYVIYNEKRKNFCETRIKNGRFLICFFTKARNNEKEPYGPVDLVYLLA